MEQFLLEKWSGYKTEISKHDFTASFDCENIGTDQYGYLVKSLGTKFYTGTGSTNYTDVQTEDSRNINTEADFGIITEDSSPFATVSSSCGAYSDDGTFFIFCGGDGTTGAQLWWSSGDSTDPLQVFDTSNQATFGATQTARFCKYKDLVLFVKGETKTIDGVIGGVFWLDIPNKRIRVFGGDNCPTGTDIAYNDNRLWVGNVSAIGPTAVNGTCMIMVSQIDPQNITATQVGSSDYQQTTATITMPSSSQFAVGDNVYINGGTTPMARAMNGNYYTVMQADYTNSTITINFDASAYSTGADNVTVSLRNQTWCPDTQIFAGTNSGAGVINIDGNPEDRIVRLCVHYSAIFVIRQHSVYLATGSITRLSYGIDSASVPSVRKLNIKYGMIGDEFVDMSGAVFFLSEQGLVKIDGISAYQMAYQQFDNIGSTVKSLDVRRVIDNFTGFKMAKYDRFLYLHNDTIHTTYQFDTVTESWTRLTGRYCQDFVQNADGLFSVYNGQVIQWEVGYQLYNPNTRGYIDEPSHWTMNMNDLGTHFFHKDIRVLEIAGDTTYTSTGSSTAIVKIYGGEPEVLLATYNLSLPSGNLNLWKNDGSLWSAKTTTWADALGDVVSEYYRKIFRLGVYHEIKIRIEHNANCYFRMFMLEMYYDVLKQYLQRGN